MNRQPNYPSFDKMRFMPPLYHLPLGRPSRRYDLEASQVYQWIAQQPELLEYIFYRAQTAHLIRKVEIPSGNFEFAFRQTA